MPRFFFDIHDGGVSRDDVGTDLADSAAARIEAINALPEVAAHEIPKDGDRQQYAVIVRDESGFTVYVATLTYMGVQP